MSISENYIKIRQEIPSHVTIVAAVKTKTTPEILELIDAGIKDIGENYIQELEQVSDELGTRKNEITMHMIGHLQSNKINKALKYCDTIQTIDSVKKAIAINNKIENSSKIIFPVLISVNIAEETAKHGVAPDFEEIQKVAECISQQKYLKLEGLMTLGPFGHTPEQLRPYFKKMKQFNDKLRLLNLPNTEIKTLSMGMSNSYKVAIEEGSNMVRLGTILLGPRNY